MPLLIDTFKANISLVALISVLVSVLGVISWFPQFLYTVYPSDMFLILHTIFEVSCLAIGLCVFVVVWYGWPQTKNSRDLVIAMIFLAVGMIDFAHLLSYKGMPEFITANSENKAAIYWIISRLLGSIGLLIAVFIPRHGKNPVFHRLYLLTVTIAAVATIIVVVPLFQNDIMPMFVPGSGQTTAKVGLEHITMVLNLLSIYMYGRRNPSQLYVYFLRISLVFSIVSSMAFSLYSNAYDSFNLIGHVYKVAAYYYILRSLLETSIIRPYLRTTRLARTLKNMAVKNIKLYKETRDGQKILQQAFIQLGATLASKHDLEAMLQQVVSATATVFRCDHAYLALAEDNPPKLKLVAYISSFKPPDKLSPEKSFMGKVFSEKKPVVIANIVMHPERITDGFVQAGLKSMVGAPIRHNGNVIGVLEIFSQLENNFTQHDAQFLGVFSHQAGEAIKNAKAYETTVESFAELSLLYDIVKELASEQSPGGLLTKVTHTLQDMFAADAAIAFILHHRDDGLHTEPVFVGGFAEGEVNHLQRVFSDGKTAWPWSGLSSMEGEENQTGRGLITMSVLISRRLNILPLLASGSLQGLIVLAWNNPLLEIPPGKEMVVSTIASQTAIGLERAYLYENVKAMALTDPLTRLANRHQFEVCLIREISRTQSFSRPVSLVMFDIDFFKKVNDTWGHLAGDAILQRLGAMLKEQFRPTDIMARYGGEEFAAILPETEQNEAVALAEAFRCYIETAKFDVNGEDISITISLGVATFDSGSDWKNPKTELVDAADQALYHAKQSGRNRVEVCYSKLAKMCDFNV